MAVIVPVATKFDDSGIKKAKSSFSGLSKSLKSTIGALGIATSFAALTNGLMDAAKAAVADQKSQVLLANQLRNTVGATNEAIAGAEAFVKTLMMQTSIADDELRPALSTLVRSTGDLGSAQKLLALSTDIAAGTGKDLSSVSIAVGKAAAGQTTALYRLIPSLKGSSDFAKDAALQFDGMAAAAANADPFQRLNIILGEIQETVGAYLLPAMQDLANYLASESFGKVLDSVFDGFDKIGYAIDTLIEKVPALGTALDGLGASLENGKWVKAIPIIGAYIDMLAGDKGTQAKNQTSASRLRGQANPASGGLYTALQMQKDANAFTKTTGTKKKTAADIAREKAQKAYEKALADLKSFQDSLKTMNDFSGLTTMTKELGEFQQNVVDTFNDINKKIAEGVANKTLGTKGLTELRNFLKAEQALLEENARQRDAVIKKRSLAQSIIDDVRSTLMGAGSLASLMEDQTKSVTTTVSKIVDGFAVTTKRTVDEVVGSKGVIGKLKDVVTKTKAFAGQLTDLKRLGLEPNLFKQIVDAGPEVGGELAKEILDGGSDSVKALNETFTELQKVTADVSEQTATVMFEAGTEIGSALVNGLLAEEQRLVDAAKQLADAFNAAYQANIMALQVPDAVVVPPKQTGTTTITNNKITVKANPVNTKATGQAVASSVFKYGKTSGGVLLRGGR